jgi:hypothetical protein
MLGLPTTTLWGIAAALVALYAYQSSRIDSVITTGQDSMDGTGNSGDGSSSGTPATATINVRLTTYYTGGYTSAAEAIQEGGANDAAQKPLITLDQHLADPSTYPYASLSGDNTVWPYGQRVSLDAWPQATFRIVDTGGHFSSNFNKVYRLAGYEPIDVASAKPEAAAAGHPTTAVMTIYPGDDFASQKPTGAQSLNWSNVQGQSPAMAGGDSSSDIGGDPVPSDDGSGA